MVICLKLLASGRSFTLPLLNFQLSVSLFVSVIDHNITKHCEDKLNGKFGVSILSEHWAKCPCLVSGVRRVELNFREESWEELEKKGS